MLTKFDQFYVSVLNEGWKTSLATAALATSMALPNVQARQASSNKQTLDQRGPQNRVVVDEPVRRISQQKPKNPLGIRNNNPGNIRVSKDNWNGKTGSNSGFVTFSDMEYGVRALARLLMNYNSMYQLNTIEGVITKWAPPNENDTASYIKNVSTWTGIPKDEKLNLKSDKAKLIKLVKAIIRKENGNGSWITDEQILDGVELALNPNWDFKQLYKARQSKQLKTK